MFKSTKILSQAIAESGMISTISTSSINSLFVFMTSGFTVLGGIGLYTNNKIDKHITETSNQIQDLRKDTNNQIQDLRKDTNNQIQDLYKQNQELILQTNNNYNNLAKEVRKEKINGFKIIYS